MHSVNLTEDSGTAESLGCAYCKNITACAICGKGYAEAVRAALGVKGTLKPPPCPGIDDRAAAWDTWDREFKRTHGYGPGTGDAFDAGYRLAWKRATSGVALPDGGQTV